MSLAHQVKEQRGNIQTHRNRKPQLVFQNAPLLLIVSARYRFTWSENQTRECQGSQRFPATISRAVKKPVIMRTKQTGCHNFRQKSIQGDITYTLKHF